MGKKERKYMYSVPLKPEAIVKQTFKTSNVTRKINVNILTINQWLVSLSKGARSQGFGLNQSIYYYSN